MFGRLLIKLIINAVALAAADRAIEGIHADGWQSIVIMALIFGAVNAIIRPIVKILSFPLLILTLGLFTFIINALMLLLAEWIGGLFSVGFHVDSFGSALLGSIIISIVSLVLSILLEPGRGPAEEDAAR
jgi:putative membrane protein